MVKKEVISKQNKVENFGRSILLHILKLFGLIILLLFFSFLGLWYGAMPVTSSIFGLIALAILILIVKSFIKFSAENKNKKRVMKSQLIIYKFGIGGIIVGVIWGAINLFRITRQIYGSDIYDFIFLVLGLFIVGVIIGGIVYKIKSK
jgi:hypothetical protein